jgi:hypothetical protein
MQPKDIRVCRHCKDDFNLLSPRKQHVGGYINECPDCVEERGGDDSPPKYLGVQAGDGKMSNVTILSFDDSASRDAYQRAWLNNSGYHKGKSCQLSSSNSAMRGMSFKRVSENNANSNHKGKSDG